MQIGNHPVVFVLACFAVLNALHSPRAAYAADDCDYEGLMKKTAPALVTVKFVLKVQGAGGAREIEREFTAVMIDPKGVVVCSSLQLGTSKLLRGRFGTATPTDIKILIGDDTEGVKAKMLASDADLDLSWIKIKEPGKEDYTFVDLTNSRETVLGATLLTMRRMDKFFDRAPVVNQGRLSGKTEKPRDLLIPSGGFIDSQESIGMPVFTGDGATIGIVVLQSPDPEEMASNPTGLRQSMAALILPANEIVKATKRACAMAEADEEEEEEKDE